MKIKRQAVWSAGEGDFLDMGSGVQKQASQDMALASATGISGGAAATVPGTFFKMNWGNQLGGSATSETREADAKVDDVDCYVLTSELKGTVKTLWIGKEDSLIHQVRNVTSAAAMQAALAEAAKRNPGIVAPPQKEGAQGVTSTETHTHIVVNPKFSRRILVIEAAGHLSGSRSLEKENARRRSNEIGAPACGIGIRLANMS